MTRPTPPLNPRSAELMAFLTGKGRKYRNEPTVIDGVSFSSRAEARRYGYLKTLALVGEITELEPHPKYVLTTNGHRLGTYTPDFRYRRADGTLVVEDVKGGPTDTQLFRWKARHMLAEHGVVVEVVR